MDAVRIFPMSRESALPQCGQSGGATLGDRATSMCFFRNRVSVLSSVKRRGIGLLLRSGLLKSKRSAGAGERAGFGNWSGGE